MSDVGVMMAVNMTINASRPFQINQLIQISSFGFRLSQSPKLDLFQLNQTSIKCGNQCLYFSVSSQLFRSASLEGSLQQDSVKSISQLEYQPRSKFL